MDPLSLTTATFLLKQGTTPVPGTVAAGADGRTAIFTPTDSLAGNTLQPHHGHQQHGERIQRCGRTPHA
jgi:hypothetical protein